jgi:hypothetical protein
MYYYVDLSKPLTRLIQVDFWDIPASNRPATGGEPLCS